MYRKLLFTLLISISLYSSEKLKLLHLSFHKGCIDSFKLLENEFNIKVESWFIPDLPQNFFDPVNHGNVLYNIGHDRAQRIWEEHKGYFNKFDAIVTSDTTPLARIFLQNNFKKPLIVWVCNRFDYHDAASLDCKFPDYEYYQLLKDAKNNKNVFFVLYSQFEEYYALLKGVDLGKLIIKPFSNYSKISNSMIPKKIKKRETFFIPSYHNNLHFIDLQKKCNELNIPVYCGRYNGPADIKSFKGVINLPGAWSNLSLFENIQNGLIHFVPSQEFILKLCKEPNYWHPDSLHLFNDHKFELSDWYTQEHKEIIVYFDSWDDLKNKIINTDFKLLKKRVKSFGSQHKKEMLKRWKNVFNKIIN